MLWMRKNRRGYLRAREDARALVHTRIRHFNAHYGLPIRKVFIKNHRSRWGSCSAKGNLNFNYKILYLPPELADYIIVHELCHLLQFDHSAQFWALVAEQIPHHRHMRKKLRQLERGENGETNI